MRYPELLAEIAMCVILEASSWYKTSTYIFVWSTSNLKQENHLKITLMFSLQFLRNIINFQRGDDKYIEFTLKLIKITSENSKNMFSLHSINDRIPWNQSITDKTAGYLKTMIHALYLNSMKNVFKKPLPKTFPEAVFKWCN